MPVLLDYDVVRSCLHRPGMKLGRVGLGRVGQCVEERKARRSTCGARCVGSVGPADRRVLEASASYYQALTVNCGPVLARSAE